MMRKSHSSEWHGNLISGEHHQSEAAMHGIALQQHFEELKAEMADFNNIFNGWMDLRRQALTSDKDAYLRTLSEEKDLVEALKKQLSGLVIKRQNVVSALQSEQREYEDGLASNRELENQKNQLANRLSEIKEQAQKLRQQTQQNEIILRQMEEEYQAKTMRESTDISLSQEKLGLYVEPIEENVTKFTFKYIDASDWERRFIITIDVSTNRYRAKSCEPMIPNLSMLLEQLNSDNDFYGFLRSVRSSFINSVSTKT